MKAPALTADELAFYEKHPSKAAADGVRICAALTLCKGVRFFRPPPSHPDRKYCEDACRKRHHRVIEQEEKGMEEAREAQAARERALKSGEWGSEYRYGFQPRSCHCNGSHVLQQHPTDGHWECVKCGGLTDGQAIFGLIVRELKAKVSPERVAADLNSRGVPMAVPGEGRKWSGRAVRKVAAAGDYLPRAPKEKREEPIGAIWQEAEASAGDAPAPANRRPENIGRGALPPEFHQVRVYRGEPFNPEGEVEVVAAADLAGDEKISFVPKKKGGRR